ncbi:MAG: integrase core domain-containing protein [Candidatus Acidiferrales bacterium]
MTKIWAGPAVGWAYLVCVIDCCTREIVGWNLSHRCRTDNGTQFTSTRFIETLNRLGITIGERRIITWKGNSYIERFHRSLKEEEVWTVEYRTWTKREPTIARWVDEYNRDRPHRGVKNHPSARGLL